MLYSTAQKHKKSLAFVPASNAAYAIRTAAAGTAAAVSPFLWLYEYDTVSRAITPASQGAQITFQLHSGRVYLIKAGLTNNTAAPSGQGRYTITIISGGGLYTPGEAITVTNYAVSDSPQTMAEYMNCLNRENWVFTFDPYGDELEDINGGISLDADGKNQSGWSPQSIDLASPSTGVGSTSAAVDATVNWSMFTKPGGL